MKKPNIIIFNPDQWRGDVLGHVGSPAAVGIRGICTSVKSLERGTRSVIYTLAK